eukprot:EG_transcript_11456
MYSAAEVVPSHIEQKWAAWRAQEHPYLADVGAAVCAAALVSPLVTMVDRAVIENASGRCNVWTSMRNTLKTIVFSPHRFVARPEFLLVTGVYCVTYGTANAVDTRGKRQAEARERMRHTKAETTHRLPVPMALTQHASPAVVQLLCTTAANMASSMTKDSILAKMFGSGPPRRFPLASFGAFMGRDITTIAAGFTIPGPLAQTLQQHTPWSRQTCEVSAQLMCPVALQLICTPMHLLGLDFYNHTGITMRERALGIAAQYRQVVLVRMGRTLPAFGIGGLGNKFFRRTFQQYLAPVPLPSSNAHAHPQPHPPAHAHVHVHTHTPVYTHSPSHAHAHALPRMSMSMDASLDM